MVRAKSVSPTSTPRGNDPDTDDREGYASGVGGDYGPAVGLLLGDGGIPPCAKPTTTGAWWFFWQHNITEDLMLHAAYGFMQMNEVADGVDDDFGSEFDLGLQYFIMKNLRYRAYLAYFMPGSYLDDTLGYETDSAHGPSVMSCGWTSNLVISVLNRKSPGIFPGDFFCLITGKNQFELGERVSKKVKLIIRRLLVCFCL